MIMFDPVQPSSVMSAGNSSASFESISFLEGNLSGFGTLEAANATMVVDSGATNSPSTVAGFEATAQVSGTAANTISDLRGITANVSTNGPGNITQAAAIVAQAPAKTSTGAITNAYSLIAEDPGSVATTDNYSIFAKGKSKFGSSALTGSGGNSSTVASFANTFPSIGIVRTGSATDEKNWDILGLAQSLIIRAVTDDNASASSGIIMYRSAAAVTNVSFPTNRVFVTTDFTTAANTSLQLITGLTITLPANNAVNTPFHCHVAYSQATATTAVAFGIKSATINPTNIFATGSMQTSATAFTGGNMPTLATTTATNIVSATPSAITTVWNADLYGMIENPSNASTNAIQWMVSTANSSDAVTVKRGSFCEIQ